ncbi:MAG TPA: hypothetical protein VKU02_04730 [Gemmataceae bacterium]|nr:hypothetical protein [Gemmataceae bacterium]
MSDSLIRELSEAGLRDQIEPSLAPGPPPGGSNTVYGYVRAGPHPRILTVQEQTDQIQARFHDER